MKKLIVLLYVLLGCGIYANADTGDKIYISVYQPERDEITPEAAKSLETKMRSLITKFGIADEDANSRFVITAKLNITSKDIVPSTPPRISEKIDFNFIIGDVIENKVFESFNISAIGIGENENKAFISAVNKINVNNEQFSTFLENAKQKIVSYYSERCGDIIVQAKQDAANRDFDAAIYKLMQIPSICDCANECQQLEIEFYTKRIDLKAEQLLNNAKAIWASSPTPEGASSAADVIAQIPSGTSSQKEIYALVADIESKLKEDQRKEWNFKMKQYNDNIAREKRQDAMKARQQIADNEYRAKQQIADNEYRAKQQVADNEFRAKQQAANSEYRARQQASDNAARSQYIEACRQVGLEYARNQPQTVVYRKNVYYW